MMESSVSQAYVYVVEHKGTLNFCFLWLPVSSAIFKTAIGNACSLDMDIQTIEYGVLSVASHCSARNTRKRPDTIQLDFKMAESMRTESNEVICSSPCCRYTGWMET